MSFGYAVEVRNALKTTARIDLRQYRSEHFDENRPPSWNDALIVRVENVLLMPGEVHATVFPVGPEKGHWVVWRVEVADRLRCDGEIDLRTAERPIRLTIDLARCGASS
jgi:hypothetical protein